VTEFVDNFLRENARRAVTRDPPLSAKEAKDRWTEAVSKKAAFYPKSFRPDYRQEVKRGGGRGGGASGGVSSRGGRGAKNGTQTRGGSQWKGKGAMYQGHRVCYQYNKPVGCSRPKKGTGCDNGNGGEFAHVCNQETGKDTYCLGQHARHNFTH
jgi:hypothetical protein